jgi:SAM-dependent methyltransferase
VEDRIQAHIEFQRQLWRGFYKTVPRVARSEEADILARFASIKPGEKVLEVGCGTGRIVSAIRRITHRAVGVDVLWEALSETRRAGTPVALVDGFTLPFRNATFDCVICNEVIHNMHPDLGEAFLQELLRVSKERILLGAIRNRFARGLDIGSLGRALRYGRWVDAADINTNFFFYWRIQRLLKNRGVKISKVAPSSHFIALFANSPLFKRLYRIKPGRIGLIGWVLPLPYGVLQYDILLTKDK